MVAWSQVPLDLLVEIVHKLDVIEDFGSFTAVCRSWNHAAIVSKWRTKVPYLLLSENPLHNPLHCRKILNLTNNNLLSLKLPQIFGARCWGLSLGWLVVFVRDRYRYLFNPLTEAKIILPPIKKYFKEYVKKKTKFISKAFILDTKYDGKVVTLAIHFRNGEQFLGFARPDDSTWNFMKTPKIVCDVHFDYKLLLIFYRDGGLGYIDMKDFRKTENLELKEFSPGPIDITGTLRTSSSYYKMYLVESGGDILMIFRYKTFGGHSEPPHIKLLRYMRQLGIKVTDDQFEEYCNFDYDEPVYHELEEYSNLIESIHFEVFKLDIKTKQWERVRNLHNMAIFVGNHSTMSINVSNAPKFKSNCIYYTDDSVTLWFRSSKTGRDIGCFDMETGRITNFYDGEDMQSKFSVASWFVPNVI